MNMAVLQFIKEALPHAQIEWLVDAQFQDVLACHKDLSAIHSISLRKNKKKTSEDFNRSFKA